MSPDQSVFIGSALAVFIYFFCNRDFLWSRCTLVHAHNEMISNADNKREREKKRSRVLRATDSILCMYNSFIECLRIIWQISIRLTLRHSDAQNEETNNNYKKKIVYRWTMSAKIRLQEMPTCASNTINMLELKRMLSTYNAMQEHNIALRRIPTTKKQVTAALAAAAAANTEHTILKWNEIPLQA